MVSEEEDAMSNQRVNTVLIDRNEDRQSQINRTVVDSGIDITGFFGYYILGGSQIREPKNDFNYLFLASGAYRGNELTKLYSNFVGTGQSIITTPVTIKGTSSVSFENITFFQDHTNPSYLVLIEEGAKATFTNCTFIRRSKEELRKAGGVLPANNSFVELNSVAASDLATFTNCKFIQRADSGATEVFRRAAALGTVYLTGNVNQTTLPYGPAASLVGGNI